MEARLPDDPYRSGHAKGRRSIAPLEVMKLSPWGCFWFSFSCILYYVFIVSYFIHVLIEFYLLLLVLLYVTL
jgi:hypothetical protein